MIVFFAGFKTGFFFGNIMDGSYGSRGGYGKMMNRDFEGGYYGNQMMLRGWVGEVPAVPASTTTTK
jgi:hypothetical protein